MKQRKILGYNLLSLITIIYILFFYKNLSVYLFSSPFVKGLYFGIGLLMLTNVSLTQGYLSQSLIVKKNLFRIPMVITTLLTIYYFGLLAYNGIKGVFVVQQITLFVLYGLLSLLNYSMLTELYKVARKLFMKNKL